MKVANRLKALVKIGAVAATASCLGMAVVPSAGADTPSADLHDSIVYINIQWTIPVQIDVGTDNQSSKELPQASSCTGWVAYQEGDSAFVMTDDHCVDPKLVTSSIEQMAPPNVQIGDPIGPKVLVVSAKNAGGQATADDGSVPGMLRAEIVDTLPMNCGDLALLRVNGLQDVKPLHMASSAVRVDDQVRAIGFPASMFDDTPRLVTSHGQVSSLPQATQPSGAYQFTVDNALWHGMSGGPIVNSDGEVVGMVDRGQGDVPTSRFVTDQTTIATFMKGNGIRTESFSSDIVSMAKLKEVRGSNTPASTTSTERIQNFMPIAVVVGAVYLLLACSGLIAVGVGLRR